MSQKAKQSKNATGTSTATATPKTTPPQTDPLQSGRSRWSLRQLYRGKDKQWHFPGQQPGEEVRTVVHKHWRFIVRTALPTITSFAAFALIGVFYIANLNTQTGSLLGILELGLFGLLLLTGGRFFMQDYIAWRLETYIITNKRIINSRGLLQPTKQETPVEKVVQTGVDQDTPLSHLLDYGNVHLYLAGGDLVMKEVPHPKEVREAIQELSDKTKKPPKEKAPPPKDPEMATLLDTLAKGKEPPKLENADDKYPLRNTEKVLGPRRTFGGPLRIPCEVHYTSGEFTVTYIQRSHYVLYKNLALPVLGAVAAMTAAFLFHDIWYIFGFIFLALLIVIALIYTNWVDDVYILTNKRIIDIQRNLFFFYESRSETEYKNIRDIKVIVHNVFERLLDIGDVFVETPGNNPDVILDDIDHPFIIQDKIYAIKGIKEKADEIEKENKSKEDLKEWFTRVLTTLEGKTQANGAPNLYKRDLWTAMEVASQFGLRVVTLGEDPSYPDLAPGLVVQQIPPPGTLVERGGEIQVVLSRRAS